jgi:hypothetical protein
MATFVYCRPEVIENPLGAFEVDQALADLASELGLDSEALLRTPPSCSVTIPNVAPEEAWDAMDRVLPFWKQRRLFFLPRLA